MVVERGSAHSRQGHLQSGVALDVPKGALRLAHVVGRSTEVSEEAPLRMPLNGRTVQSFNGRRRVMSGDGTMSNASRINVGSSGHRVYV